MKKSRWIVALTVFVGILSLVCFGSCAIPKARPAARGPRNEAFIVYWPPPSGSTKMRLAVKDLIDMKGVVTTAGSQYVGGHSPPARQDAQCLQLARAGNVQIVGKTNLSEFAVAPSGFNEYYGTPKNPITQKQNLIPGGSSSGSAVAVATGLADVAFGTDTTGSIRLPAACCGVVGLKTTFGLVDLKGVYPIEATHLDTVGPLARDIAHEVQGMNLLKNGFEGEYRSAMAAKPTGKRIRVGRLYLDGTDANVDKSVNDALAKADFQVIRLDDRFKAAWNQAKKDTEVVAAAGAWINDSKFSKLDGISTRTKAVLLLGQFNFPGSYRAALRRQPQWKRTVARILSKVDFIAVPTIQTTPPKVSPRCGSPLFETAILSLQNTAAVNIAGNPALAMPIPLDSKEVLITSLQLVGPLRGEAKLLNAGRIVEAACWKPKKTLSNSANSD